MDQVTFFWALVSMTLAGVQVFFQRVIAKEGRDGAFSGLMMYAVSGVLAVVGLMFVGDLSLAWLTVVMIGFASGITHGIGNFLRIEALKNIDSVIYFPINKVLGPLIAILGGVLWFSEVLNTRELIGIALSLMVPLILVSAGEHGRQLNLRKGLTLLVISTVFTSVAMLLTKAGTNLDTFILLQLAATQVAGAISSIVIFAYQKKDRLDFFSHLDRRDLGLGVLVGVLGFASYFTYMKALTTGYISLVYTIHAHYILIPIVLSVWWYKDHINMRKLVAVLVSFLAISFLYSP